MYVLGECAAGSFSADGRGSSTVDCRFCPLGYFSTGTGQTTCTQCAAGLTTLNVASTSADECVNATVACETRTCNGNGRCDISAGGQVVCLCEPGTLSTRQFENYSF